MHFFDIMCRSKSRIVLALDLTGPSLLDRALRILDETYEYLAAVKVNRHLSIPLSLEDLNKLTSAIHDRGLPAIMDCKVNDIGSTNRVMAELFFNAGFDALTVSPLTGWEEGLEPVYEVARSFNRGILELVYMSHPGASRYYEALILNRSTLTLKALYEVLLEEAIGRGADGLIVAATRPSIVSRVKRAAQGRSHVYSPGVGYQGGSASEAVKAGADFLIVGRSIVLSSNPKEEALKLYRLVSTSLARGL